LLCPDSRGNQIEVLKTLEEGLAAKGSELSRRRREAAGKLRVAVEYGLADLAMSGSRFDVRIGWDACHQVASFSHLSLTTVDGPQRSSFHLSLIAVDSPYSAFPRLSLITVDSPQRLSSPIAYYSRKSSKRVFFIEQVLKVTDFCGDGRAVIQPDSFPDAGQVLKVTIFPGSAGCSLKYCRLYSK
jgi:hypothetical protein